MLSRNMMMMQIVGHNCCKWQFLLGEWPPLWNPLSKICQLSEMMSLRQILLPIIWNKEADTFAFSDHHQALASILHLVSTEILHWLSAVVWILEFDERQWRGWHCSPPRFPSAKSWQLPSISIVRFLSLPLHHHHLQHHQVSCSPHDWSHMSHSQTSWLPKISCSSY